MGLLFMNYIRILNMIIICHKGIIMYMKDCIVKWEILNNVLIKLWKNKQKLNKGRDLMWLNLKLKDEIFDYFILILILILVLCILFYDNQILW